MRKIIAAIIAGAALLACHSHAQTNTFLPGFSSGITNAIVTPYVKYDLDHHDFGYGAAYLLKVTDIFYAGVRVDRINGQQTTGGVQANLQDAVSYKGFTVHPFLESTVGMGNSSLYASAGPGIYVNLYSHSWVVNGDNINLGIGVIGDFEHVVDGTQNSNQINAGPTLHLSF